MGYASYLEDITSRITTMDEIVRDHSPSHKREVHTPVGIKKQNDRLHSGMDKLRRQVMELQTIIERMKKDNAEKGFLLRKEQGKSDSLSKKIELESGLRKTQEKVGRDWSELVIDFKQLFKGMSEITKSNAWHKDRSKIKQLESLIDSGLRKN